MAIADYKTSEVFCSSNNKQLLIRTLLRKTKNTNMVGGWKLKFTFDFMNTTHEPLHLDELSFIQRKVMDCFL
jgi:hypothetical protein